MKHTKNHSFGYPSVFFNKHLSVTLIYIAAPASYPNVSLSLSMKICAQKEAGDHQSLAYHSRFALTPSAKNEAFKGAGAAQLQPTYPSPKPAFFPK